MTIPAIKVHPLIDDGKLIFSYEMEKLDMPRHANFSITLKKSEDILLSHGYSFKTIDSLVFDGWDRCSYYNAPTPLDEQKQLSFKVAINARNLLEINKLAYYGHFVSMAYSYKNGPHGSLYIRGCPAGKP